MHGVGELTSVDAERCFIATKGSPDWADKLRYVVRSLPTDSRRAFVQGGRPSGPAASGTVRDHQPFGGIVEDLGLFTIQGVDLV